ncbi:DUF3604 domain-containing protein [Microbulbifer elongatus]|uniref:DUF3604 domain-containing protein n=1 Tax=Microbulbifer elongatus TaxID=86173 RepID=UPI001CFD0EA9|nr:DUF3604 domain-containing protein [Microbulbifer elongatus]
MRNFTGVVLAVLLLAGCGGKPESDITANDSVTADSAAAADEAAPVTADKSGEEVRGRTGSASNKSGEVPSNPLRDAYFGELHIHTSYSLDAYIFGNVLNDPFSAYRFAKGETVKLPTGQEKKIIEPLDFVAITDHAEVLGEYEMCNNPKMQGYDNEVCVQIRANDMKVYQALFAGVQKNPSERLAELCGEDGKVCRDAVAGPWQRIQQAAEENYEPGKFTSLVAFEYSNVAPEGAGGMMHRNVIFRTDKVPETVFSAFEGSAEDLLRWLDDNCTGDCQVLTIPHNPNFYWGRLYWGKNSDGSEWNQGMVELRERMDRLVEVMQVKGNSECVTGVMTSDEACNFEVVFPKCEGDNTVGCANEFGVVRNGLKFGLRHQADLGVNPFKQGIIASTDNHNATPSDTVESEFLGHYANNDASPKVRLGLELNPTAAAMGMSGEDDPTKLYNPGGIAGVWAESNTREGIWDALHRKETFGTSGTRTKIRLFAGFDFPADMHSKDNWVAMGYESGVPQGGDLSKAADGKAPTLMVWAQRDPNSAPLARLQIIKGWRTADDKLEEMTYDVACSDGATPDPKTHQCPDNGATVNLEDCSISSDKGDAQLAATWTDPDFDPAEHAFYYARVLENPVCRWSMYDAKKAGVEHPKDLPKTIRERAWSSPIWYTP